MLCLDRATKTYRKGDTTVVAAEALSVEILPGDFAVIHGPSGSGKSTFLLLAGGMLAPDEGDVLFQGESVYAWSTARRNRYRREKVGFIFQRFHLLPYLSVADNIRLPLRLQNQTETDDSIVQVAQRLGIAERLSHRPSELSIGEQQRVAVARALVGDPKIILADEPTGNLDPENAQLVADVLTDEAAQGRMVAMVTHNTALLEVGTRRLRLEHGRLSADTGAAEAVEAAPV